MNREDIIRMAREAGRKPERGVTYQWDSFDIERFAALVAAAEREACAKVCENAMSGANELMDVTREINARAIRARNEK